MRYDRERKAQTRERVLKEAAAAIRADGPDRVGVAAIMARAGLTHGGFYAHFASKDALLAEAVDHMFADGAAAYAAGAEGDAPGAALARHVDAYLSMRHRNGRDRGCPVPILAGELHRLPQAARERFAAAVGRMRARLADLAERAGADRPTERAGSALSEMVGAVALARVLGDAEAAALLAAARVSVRRTLAIGD